MRLIREIMTLLLGYKYRVVVLKTRGTCQYWVNSEMFEDTEAGNRRLDEYLERLETDVRLYEHWETVSFRSRKAYAGILREEMRAETNDEILKRMRRGAGKRLAP